ncbi:uncharacterized protein BDZ99DRAFT_442325 [Mytilinidion resinicola]|uniref:F-box domain-containing protein n=1 Tax=Mytilinidion resinicola TaxID=574789 RepID=A0A6A6YQ04_9PEZI|nr:uncharacterized protein BDZ99DRAFT_442325 [Mytilinidion resinicola]KAF2809957.1 hypothetical protein BDZ99DRAFT_442325 [Mytilinidion resinicola]
MPPTNNPAEQRSRVDSNASPTSNTRQSEGLRNALASSRRNAIGVAVRTTRRHLTNPIQSQREGFSIRRERRRISLQRVLTRFFDSSPPVTNPSTGHIRRDSSTSDGRSISKVDSHGSLQSLDLVSPGTFLFSGPSLRSAYSRSSFGYSTSFLESKSSLGTVGNDSHFSVEDFPVRMMNAEQPPADYVEDGILEPFLYCDVTRSMSDIILRVGSPIEERDDTVSEGSFTNYHSLSSMRLTCRSWYSAISAAAHRVLPPPCRLPNELIQHIYSFLSPRDFNAARHTCQTWMTASLDRTILKSMLRRGGWMGGAEHDLRERGILDESVDQGRVEWFLSKLLSRECALSCNWTGNGLETPGTKNSKYHEPLVEVARTDFADLANGSAGPEGRHTGALVFTVSVCGRFLLVAEGGMIYIYQLEDSSLRPLTSVVCPRRVLAMSMDASSHRFAIAALLEGRMGLVCDLNLRFSDTGDSAIPTSAGVNDRATFFTSEPRNPFEDPMAMANDNARFAEIRVQAGDEEVNLRDTDRDHERNNINLDWHILLRGGPRDSIPGAKTQAIPVDNGRRSIYRHLCSDDDPPRCVSICPQRRCVAFGCSAGIELYWVDAITGQNLNRWFPLTSPSDFLHFLPPRPGVDSAKKLRLISSAAHPSDRPSIYHRFLSNRPNPSLYWGSFGLETPLATHGRGGSNSDHFRAVPLSDGYNVLFTDPSTSRLYLGSDAPQGGPTKLLRTLMLMPPDPDDIPRIYTAAADLTWGARVAVAFGDKVVLYSVPPDLRLIHAYAYPSTPAIWPIGIKGTVVGALDGLAALAIYAAPELTIWAFGADGRAVTWQLDTGRRPRVVAERSVGRDGLVGDNCDVDVDGDVVMADAEEAEAEAEAEGAGERSVGFDGQASGLLGQWRLPGVLHVANDEFLNGIDVSSGEAWYDRDGDIVMFDADTNEVGWTAEDWLVQER